MHCSIVFHEMGSKLSWWASWVFLVCGAVLFCECSDISVKLLNTPRQFSNRNSAAFGFQVLVGSRNCNECSVNCKLDNTESLPCSGGNINYTSLFDGNHEFEVCAKDFTGVACTSYKWTVDTVNPSAFISTPTSFTSASQVLVNISFSEPCPGRGGFGCSSVNACNLIVYGAGEVVPSTLAILQPYLKYSVNVRLPERFLYGRVILVMDKSFCTDTAGNLFKRNHNSSYFIHFDRRIVNVNLKTHIREQLLPINSEPRTVMATNKNKNLKIYLYFTEPVLNSSSEILNSVTANVGSLVPVNGDSFGWRRFGYQLVDVSEIAIITLSVNTNAIISRQGTAVAPVSPITFLYDSERPTVRLSTTCKMRTNEKNIHVVVKFIKPVFGFNSSHVSISGGRLQKFLEMSRSIYLIHIQAVTDIISINVPENITTDVSGNRNEPSNTLQIRHYSVPIESSVLSIFTTAAFALTCLVAGVLTVSTATLLSVGAFSRPSSILTSDAARNLFRITYRIQVFALSKWLASTLPIEYYELVKGLQWSIPYLDLPWERERAQKTMGSTASRSSPEPASEVRDWRSFEDLKLAGKGLISAANETYGLPLTGVEYRSYFESHNIVPQAEYLLDLKNSHGWRDFGINIFWLSIVCGIFILVHVLFLLIIKWKRNKENQSFGALVFPRFELFLLILALPCFCEASTALIKGGTSGGTIVGFLILSIVGLLMLSLLLFLTFGITFGNLLQYKEVHHEGQSFRWYKEIIRAVLGPGKRGQWTWKNQPSSVNLTILGPLFEDLRGPPKYMLSQIYVGRRNKPDDRIIASDDETEDAEAPIIQKLFGILRVYYTMIEIMKRVALGIIAGAYMDNWSSRTPTIILLSFTTFQLFFLVLKKPFIKKRVQLVEIISVASEVAIFAICYVFLDQSFSPEDEKKIGISMLLVFLLSFLVQMINEWYALYRHIQRLDPIKNSFLHGLETALIGLLLFLCPNCLTKKKLDKKLPINNTGETGDATSVDRFRSSGDKSWLKQIQELARSSFSREGNLTDPSTSKNAKMSGFWRSKTGGSSTMSTPAEANTRPRGLYKELEEIFSSK